MDFDVIVIGSGFGGAVTGYRLAEAGYKVLILERGRRWSHDSTQENFYPRAGDSIDKWIFDHKRPERRNGWIDFRLFPNMTVVQGAGVGGGSLIYANVSVEAPPSAFATGWPAGFNWYQELKPHYDRVADFMDIVEVPASMFNGRTLLMKEAAEKLGQPERFKPLTVAVYFGDQPPAQDWWQKEPVRPDQPVFRTNKHGVAQASCYHCGLCDTGCDVNARNTLDTNYLYVAENKKGAKIRELHIVSHIEPINGGYRVHCRNLKDPKMPASQSARIVILAAGSLGSTELLLNSRDVYGTLPRVSPFLGRNWTSNGDFLTPAYYSNRDVYPSTGITISSAIDFHDGSQDGQRFWIQDGGFPDVLAQVVKALGAGAARWLKLVTLVDFLKHFLHRANPAHHVMPWFAQGVDAGDGVLRLKRTCFVGPRRLHLDWDVTKSRPVFDAIVKMHERLSALTGGDPQVPVTWSVAGDLITPHPLGGCNMGTSADNGVVDHAGRVFNYENLYVADGAIIPRPIGVNPSRTIAALAERIAAQIIAGPA